METLIKWFVISAVTAIVVAIINSLISKDSTESNGIEKFPKVYKSTFGYRLVAAFFVIAPLAFLCWLAPQLPSGVGSMTQLPSGVDSIDLLNAIATIPMALVPVMVLVVVFNALLSKVTLNRDSITLDSPPLRRGQILLADIRSVEIDKERNQIVIKTLEKTLRLPPFLQSRQELIEYLRSYRIQSGV